MKAVILAGGLGTRISEESVFRPKPMIEIGNYPILWHIMKNLYHQGITEFIICAGYKQHMIKEYFADYHLHRSDVTFDFDSGGDITIHSTSVEKWRVTVVDTGLNTMTGGRIKRIRGYLGQEPFLLTYGDGVSDVDVNKLVQYHQSHDNYLTITAVHPIGRFGVLRINGDYVTHFGEKTESETDWINGGFMIVDPKVIDYIKDDKTVFEQDPLTKLSEEGKITAFKHYGFWQCMDTLRDKQKLEKLWEENKAPWKIWND